MTTVIRTQNQIVVARSQAGVPTVVRPGVAGGAPGAKGDPGGNVMAIGLFTAASGLTIATGTDLVRTTGYSTTGVGSADYVYDATVDSTWVAAHPGGGFVSANSRGFRLAGQAGAVTPFMFGAVDCTGSPKLAGETVTDCITALDAMWALVKYLAVSKDLNITMDLSGCMGLGISRTWLLDVGYDRSFWDTPVFRIIPGRLVATALMSEMVKLKGKTFNVVGEWQLYGAVYDQLALGYAGAYAKYGLVAEDVGGSNIGSIRGEALRRYLLRFSNSYGNNIPTTVGNVLGARVGSLHVAGALSYSGTYASGSWTDTAGHSDSYSQVHRMTLTPTTGVIPTDLEVGDLLDFGSGKPGCVMNIVSSTGTTITVDIYPWQSSQVSGTFTSMHGGGVDCDGGNLANTTIGTIETLNAGTALRLSSLYCPTIRSLLAESTGCAVQLGKANLESMEGLNVEHYHIENVTYSIIDCAAATSAAWFGIPSNMEGTGRGKLDKCLRLNPAQYIAGAWAAPTRTSMCGVGFRFNGGSRESPIARNIEYNTLGANYAVIGNSPEYQFGPCYANNFDFYLIAERSMAEQLSDRRAKLVEWGPIYGSGTHGAPTGNVVFQVWSGDLLGGSTTVDGGATRTLTSTDGALQGVAVYEPPIGGGNNGNWKIFSWKATGA